jgi:hypothetical protein
MVGFLVRSQRPSVCLPPELRHVFDAGGTTQLALFTLLGERMECDAILPRRSPENYSGLRALFQPMDGGPQPLPATSFSML